MVAPVVGTEATEPQLHHGVAFTQFVFRADAKQVDQLALILDRVAIHFGEYFFLVVDAQRVAGIGDDEHVGDIVGIGHGSFLVVDCLLNI